MANPRADIDMYTVADPRSPTLTLRDRKQTVAAAAGAADRNRGRARREAQWPTWQRERSWPERASASTLKDLEAQIELVRRRELREGTVWAAAFIFLIAILVAFLAAGYAMGVI